MQNLLFNINGDCLNIYHEENNKYIPFKYKGYENIEDFTSNQEEIIEYVIEKLEAGEFSYSVIHDRGVNMEKFIKALPKRPINIYNNYDLKIQSSFVDLISPTVDHDFDKVDILISKLEKSQIKNIALENKIILIEDENKTIISDLEKEIAFLSKQSLDNSQIENLFIDNRYVVFSCNSSNKVKIEWKTDNEAIINPSESIFNIYEEETNSMILDSSMLITYTNLQKKDFRIIHLVKNNSTVKFHESIAILCHPDDNIEDVKIWYDKINTLSKRYETLPYVLIEDSSPIDTDQKFGFFSARNTREKVRDIISTSANGRAFDNAISELEKQGIL